MLEQQKPLFTLSVLGDGNTVLAASFLHILLDGKCYFTICLAHLSRASRRCPRLQSMLEFDFMRILQLLNMQGAQTGGQQSLS